MATKTYTESEAVKKAQAMLQQQLASKPGEYQSQWQTQLNDTINKILNREKFSYDLNGDMLYQQYKDQYTNQGNMAMMDTMGQAQAMTGGYGNSYAQTAGQQTYQGYLQQLNDKVPELYNIALNKYNQDGQELYNQYSLLGSQEEQDYNRYLANMAQWQTELDRRQNQYNAEREFDYGKYTDDRNYQYQVGRDQVADQQWQTQMNYQKYMDNLNYQYQVSRDKVADAKWQQEFNEAMRQYNQSYALSVSKANSSNSNNSSNNNNNNNNNKNNKNTGKLTYSDVALTAAQMRKKGASANDIYQYISSVLNSSNYIPSTSVKQDLAELKSAYVGVGR